MEISCDPIKWGWDYKDGGLTRVNESPTERKQTESLWDCYVCSTLAFPSELADKTFSKFTIQLLSVYLTLVNKHHRILDDRRVQNIESFILIFSYPHVISYQHEISQKSTKFSKLYPYLLKSSCHIRWWTKSTKFCKLYPPCHQYPFSISLLRIECLFESAARIFDIRYEK